MMRGRPTFNLFRVQTKIPAKAKAKNEPSALSQHLDKFIGFYIVSAGLFGMIWNNYRTVQPKQNDEKRESRALNSPK